MRFPRFEGGWEDKQRTSKEVLQGWLERLGPDELPVVLLSIRVGEAGEFLQGTSVQAYGLPTAQDIVALLRESADHIEKTERRQAS